MLRRRYLRILMFFGSILLQMGWWDILLPRLGLRGLSRRSRAARLQRITVRFRALAIRMGGVMIKVGQFMSSRLDVLPREVTDILSGLQDEVGAEAIADIRKVIESEFNGVLEERFSDFQPQPIASASIGQVHLARMRIANGVEADATRPFVVVKVQRPNIEAIVDTDLSALHVVGGWLNAYGPVRRRANVPALLAEFSRSLYEELDYLNEGKNAEHFAADFAADAGICVPKVYWSHTTRRVLTLENIEAIKITDYSALEAAGIDRGLVAKRLFDVYLKQIFEDRFFHADPHPGNLFVLPMDLNAVTGKRSWQLVFVDFGMAGSISAGLLDALRELFIAVGTRDSARLIRAYQMMGVLLPGADVELLEKANMQAFDRFWGKSTTEMVGIGQTEIRSFIKEFEGLLYEMPFQIPENLILLGRSLSILSGICTGLNPDFNIWTSVEPYAEKLVASEGVGGNWQVILKEISTNVLAVLTLPKRAGDMLSLMERGRLEVRMPQLVDQVHRLERGLRRLVWAVLFMTLLFAGLLLFLNGYVLPSIILWVISGIFLLLAIF